MRAITMDLRGGLKSEVRRTSTFFVNGLRHESPSGPATLPTALEQAGHWAAVLCQDGGR